jgi:DNA-binding CsgD family transcriptional regulator/DNA-binding winged helix-turn-helix (wHTH) protein
MRLGVRQAQILELVFIGKTNREIGTILGISERTAKRHVLIISRKLGAHNRQNAVFNALVQGYLTVPAPHCFPVARREPPAPAAPPITDWIEFGNMRLSESASALEVGGKWVSVRCRSLRLLALFMRAPERELVMDDLIEGAYPEDPVHASTVGEKLRLLRRALCAAGASHTIQTTQAKRYRLVPAQEFKPLRCGATTAAAA